MVLSSLDTQVVANMLLYAKRLSSRGYVMNTLGSVAVRVAHPECSGDIVYTKRKGVSLEEMESDDVVATTLTRDLLFGHIPPSIGHQLNCAIFRERPDAHAVIHVHPNLVIGWGVGVPGLDELPIISADAPLIFGAPVLVLDPEVNVETDTALVPSFIQKTNCFIMPNHGVTALGGTVSEAYHRICTCVAEVERVIMATMLATTLNNELRVLDREELAKLYAMSKSVIYGGTEGC